MQLKFASFKVLNKRNCSDCSKPCIDGCLRLNMSKFIKSIKFSTKSSNFIHHKKLPEELSLHDDDFEPHETENDADEFTDDDATRNLQPKDGKSKSSSKFHMKYLGYAELPLPLSLNFLNANCKSKAVDDASSGNNTSMNTIKFLLKVKKSNKSGAPRKAIVKFTAKGLRICRDAKNTSSADQETSDKQTYTECDEEDISIFAISNCGLHTVNGRTYFTLIALQDDVRNADEKPKECCYAFECANKKQAKRLATTISEVFAQAASTQYLHGKTSLSTPAPAPNVDPNGNSPVITATTAAAASVETDELICLDDVLNVTKKWVSFDEISQTSITNLILI